MNIKASLVFFYLKKIKKIVLPQDLIKEAVKKNKDNFEVYERGKKLANSLSDLGFKKGDKVALLMYNCKEYFEIRIAGYLSGIVLCPLVPDTATEDIIFIIKDCKAKAVIFNENLLSKEIRENINVQLLISLEKDYEPLLAKGKADEPKIILKPEDLASINFSSGTTGRPKGIMLMQKSWINSFYNYALNSPRASSGDIKILHIISLATAGGTAFLPSFFLGMENFFIDKFEEGKVVSFIIENKINTIFLPPSLLNVLIDYCKNKKINLPLKNVVIGTEYISKEKFKEAIEFFGPIIQAGYGMAEVLPPLSLICSKDYLIGDKIDETKLIFAGKPMRGVKIKIVDKKGKIGRIAIKSKTVSHGYWNNLDLTKKYYKDGWFVSDDFGYISEDGYLYVAGREQDIIDENNMVFSRDIEETLLLHPNIFEAVVFKKDNKVYAFISFKKGADTSDSPKNSLVDEIKILPNLPKNFSGKIDRKKLRNL